MIEVTSQGGPLIVVPYGELPHWGGGDPPTDGGAIQVQRPYDPSRPATDYDRACAVRRAGPLMVGDAEALVLSREADNAMWLPRDERGRGDVFLGQLSIDDHERFRASLMTIVDQEFPASDVVWHVREPQLRLFDSAMPGTAIATPTIDVALSPGTYEVRTMFFKAPGVAEVFMHKLVRRE